ncbi:MAG: hypothetical protein AB3N28_12695 [Kordiimonas sp.]
MAAPANVTQLRKEQPVSRKTPSQSRAIGKPSIRIIKTDEDLMAERTRDAGEPVYSSEPLTNSETDKAPAHTQAETEAATAPKPEAALDPSLQQFVNEKPVRSPIKDPGPGGWAWRSDRDGIISSLSPKGLELLGNGQENTGTTVLDILGLNLKVGHPVARAFQRRSTIHDAPIFLASMEPSHQHWTLEATPFFSSCGGIFEGYEGILTPITAATEESDQLLPSEEDANALFLDEVAPSRRAAIGAGNAFTQSVSGPTPPVVEAKSSMEASSKPMEKSASPKTPNLGDTTKKVATSALEEVISETLKPLTEALEQQKTPPSKKADAPKPMTSSDLNLAEIRSTLDLLEEALARLTIAGKNAGDIQVRLQSEIASACARTLRDLLSK